MMRWKRALSIIVACAGLCGFTACGALPEEFPEIDVTEEEVETYDKFQVDFFFQNNENTYCIRPDGDAYNFFTALSQTFSIMSYSDISKTYILDYDQAMSEYGIVEYDRNNFDNMFWDDARSVYSYSGANSTAENNFYVLDDNYDISMDSRVDGGMLGLFVDEVERSNIIGDSDVVDDVDVATETSQIDGDNKNDGAEQGESFFDPDAINVIFTDLSEKNITYLGEALRNFYTADNRYSACILAIQLEVESGYPIYYASKDNANSLTCNDSGDSRWYYLVMTGPTTNLATFVQNLTVHLGEVNLNQGSENGGYELSDLNFTSENFDSEEDLRVIPSSDLTTE